METPAQSGRELRFGGFRLNLRTGELSHSGGCSLLPEQPFQILAMLLERPGQLVTREELTNRLWPSNTFVDFDHSLNRAVNRLREALGDSAERPRYIETLPRRGYRFIAPVELQDPGRCIANVIPAGISSASHTDSKPQLLHDRRRDSSGISVSGNGAARESTAEPRFRWDASNRPSGRSRTKHYGALAVCIALLTAAFGSYYSRLRSNSPSVPTTIRQISQWNKPMRSARLSPDGHAVAFASRVGGVEQVFLMLTSGGEPLQLTNDVGDKYVDDFSPDGKEVYYGRSLGRREVWAVPTLGGSPHPVASTGYLLPSPDDASIFYTKWDNPGVFRAQKSGLNEELVFNAGRTGRFFSPILLFPGGDELLATGARTNSPNVLISRINLTSHEAVDLGEISVSFDNPGFAWAEPGSSILLSRTVNGLTNIWKYGLHDRSLTQITFGTGPDYSPMPDPGGKGIYYVNGKSSGSLSAYNVRTKKSTDIVSDDATQPSISPDGKRLMYVTLAAGKRHELWVSDIDGIHKVKIATGENFGTGRWAPDSFHLSFTEAGASGGPKVYIIAADGSGLRQLPPMGYTNPDSAWSADQKSVYVSAAEIIGGAGTNVWRWNVASSNLEKFVDECCLVSDVDPTGNYLLGAELAGEGTGIYEVSISERKCIPLLRGVVTFGATFARDGKSFLYAVASRGEVTIYRQPWSGGKLVGTPQVALKVPFAFPINYEGNAYDFSRDLSTIVYARPSAHADLYLLSQK